MSGCSILQLLVLAGVEYGDALGVPLRQRRHIAERDKATAMSLVGALLEGAVGLLSEPVRYGDSQFCSAVVS